MDDSDGRRRADTMQAHEQAMRDGSDGYVDPESGLFVFTAAYLEARGACCDSGCRHCPYSGAPPAPLREPPNPG